MEEARQQRPKKKVTRKQLRRRRIGGLIVLLLIIFLMSTGCASCIRCACGSGKDNNSDEEATTSTTAVTEQTVLTTAGTTLPQEQLVANLPEYYNIDIPVIYNEPELPTGGEVTSLAMVLNFMGYSADKQVLASDYLPCAERGEATFTQAFIGSPFESDGMGCFAPVIAETAQKFIAAQGGGKTVKMLNADNFDEVLLRVASGYPVLVWVNSNLELRQEEYCFTVYGTGNVLSQNTEPPMQTSTIVLGTTAPAAAAETTETTTTAAINSNEPKQDVYWISNATCVVLKGFDTENDTVTVIDPAQGEIIYDMGMFKTSYNALSKQAVIIY